MTGLGGDNLRRFAARSAVVENDVAHVDTGKTVRSALFLQQLGQCHAEELAHIAARNHLLQTLLARFFRVLVKFLIQTIRDQLHESAGFQIENHRLLRAVRIRFEIAGVMTGSIDGADIDVRLLIGGGQKDRNRIIDHGRRFNIVKALTVQRSLEQIIDHLPLDAGSRKFLCPDDKFCIVEIRLF